MNTDEMDTAHIVALYLYVRALNISEQMIIMCRFNDASNCIYMFCLLF